jgi:gluconate 2-dehydrogenase gamma chain
MSEVPIKDSSRRGFLRMVTVAIGAAASPATVAAGWAHAAESQSRYRCLSREEGAFTEAMVNVLCPADQLTPDGVTCGLATSIDRALAGENGPAVRHFKAGVAAANMACQERFGMRFDELVQRVPSGASDAAGFLHDIAAGRVSAPGLALDLWLNERVNPLLVKASFAEPIYDRHCNRVFWKIFAQAGASA